MLQAINVSLQYGSRVLFKDVNLKFTKGNCYGVIGANGAGKSTFLKILSGVLEPNKGEVIKDKDERLSVLNQDQNAFDNETVIRTVLLGNKRLVEIMDEQEALYSKADFSEEDGIKVGELQMEFAELNGWEAESDAKILLNGLGINDEKSDLLMKDLDSKEKVKVLLAQALFGNPDILILDDRRGAAGDQDKLRSAVYRGIHIDLKRTQLQCRLPSGWTPGSRPGHRACCGPAVPSRHSSLRRCGLGPSVPRTRRPEKFACGWPAQRR